MQLTCRRSAPGLVPAFPLGDEGFPETPGPAVSGRPKHPEIRPSKVPSASERGNLPPEPSGASGTWGAGRESAFFPSPFDEAAHRETGSRNLCMAGGVALIMRLLGRNPIVRNERDGSFWVPRPDGEGRRSHLTRQF